MAKETRSVARRIVVSACFFLCCTSSFADTIDNILKASDSQLIEAAKTMAENLARTAPTPIDSTTFLLGAILSQQTKTFIYKYESSIRLDPSRMAEMIPRHTCADRIRRAFMTRGFTFKHVYITPAGQQEQAVKIHNCR